ncbi:thioesterase [Streptomyces sp. NA04227]|uniref:thioesterase II family protein n=1 Tax=Streptomyces sp. NA04227 TaxID=2742136 RepID=UPI0015910240|nr:alpha/beta fold hydrolase [Streptomyces sp. NA04227]QKW10456.1 thioesterase [Streptomyces sp. NA04227]
MAATPVADWLPPAPPGAVADAVTLICLPHAGAGPGGYRPLARLLLPRVALRPVRLPGRESRVGEAALPEATAVVRALVPALVPQLRGRFALWGHSMGGYLAFELARLLEARFGLRAEALIVSGCPAPTSPARAALPQRSLMDDDQLWSSAAELNGIPAEVLGDAGLRALLLPTLRADFAVFETYVRRPGPPLGCPVHAFSGQDDPEARGADMAAWGEETRADFHHATLPGGHFFPLEDPAAFGEALVKALTAPN